MLAAPAVSRAKMHTEVRTRAYRYSRSIPAFPAQWFYGLCRAPRRRIRLVTVIGELTALRARSGSQHLRRLDTSNGRQDHTVLPYASASFVCRAADRSRAKARPAIALAQPALPRPPHSEPNVRDTSGSHFAVGDEQPMVKTRRQCSQHCVGWALDLTLRLRLHNT